MQIQMYILILSFTCPKGRMLYITALFLFSLSNLFWSSFLVAPKKVSSLRSKYILRATLCTRKSLSLFGSWTGLGRDPALLLISFMTLGKSPLPSSLHYLIKRGHCEIKWDSVINRALLSASLKRWWFSSSSSVLFYCFILYNIISLTVQSSKLCRGWGH